MKQGICFFKAHSRMGMKNIPIHGTKLNLGVEFGSNAVLTAKFLSQFKNSTVVEYTCPNPENISPRNFNRTLLREIKSFKKIINKNIKPGQTQVVVGGDHSVAFPSILAILDRLPKNKKLGYIQIDSHGDMNLSADSPTDNWHGMYLRPLIGNDFDIPKINKLITKKLLPQNMIFIGNLDLDEKERQFFESKKIKNITKQDLMKKTKEINNFLNKFIINFDHLHLSIDIDGFNHSIAPATGIPAQNGLLAKNTTPLLKIISKHPDISIDLVEVNPKKPGIKKTTQLAQQLLTTLLK